MPNPAPSREAMIESLVECGRTFYERRWMWGTAGNLSVKLKHDPLEIAITPSGVHKGELNPKDLITLKDTPVTSKATKKEAGPVPSAETVIHQAIHKALPGCGAVFHVHPMYATLMSGLHGAPNQRQLLRFDWIEMMKGIGVGEGEVAELPIFANYQDVSLVAKDIEHYLAETPKAPPVALIYNHGVTGWGRTPEQARNHLEIVEYVCEYLYRKKLLKN
jgi:methylthioribose-1-phosphate isomerase